MKALAEKTRSVRFRLTAIFALSVLIPFLLMIILVMTYYVSSAEESALSSADSTAASISKNVEIYLNDLENITLIPYMNDEVMNALKMKQRYAEEELPDEEKYEINRALTYELPLYFQLMRQEISDLLILPVDGSIYLMSANSSYYQKEFDYWSQDWYREALEADGSAVIIGNHEQDYIDGSSGKRVFSVTRQIKDIETQETLAVILADMETSILESLLQNIPFDEGAYCFIMDGDGEVVCASRRLPDGALAQLAGIAREEGERETEDYLVSSAAVEGTDWEVMILLSREILNRQNRGLYLLCVPVSVLFLLGGCMVFALFSRSVTQPLTRLSTAMKEVQKGNFQVHYQAESRDEIAELGETFNTMVEKINELIEKEYKAVLAQKDMEYYALQSQIQPHFIYNVLNNLIGLNRAGERETMEKTILSLTEVLRYMLQQTDMVPVGVELEVLERYCELQKLRFGARLEYIITCEEEYLPCYIPKLLLQPLVENAILHGIEPKQEGGTVTLMGEGLWVDGGAWLVFTVSDDGVGFDPEEAHGSGVGMRNVEERLTRVFAGAVLHTSSRKGEGTIVQIRIPGKELKRDEDCHSG